MRLRSHEVMIGWGFGWAGLGWAGVPLGTRRSRDGVMDGSGAGGGGKLLGIFLGVWCEWSYMLLPASFRRYLCLFARRVC